MKKLLPLTLLLALTSAHAQTPVPAPAPASKDNTGQQTADHAALTQMLRALNLTSSLQTAFRQNLIDSGAAAEKPLAQCIIAHFDEPTVLDLLLPGFDHVLTEDEAQRLTHFFQSGTGQKIADALNAPQSAEFKLTPAESKTIEADPPLAAALAHLSDSLSNNNQQIGQHARDKALTIANTECREYLPKPVDTVTAPGSSAAPGTPVTH